MKKKIAIAALLTLAPAGYVMAQSNNVGCGLGSIVFEGQSGIAPQVLAVTTNSLFGNQTFGISFATLGCARDGVVSVPGQIAIFLDTNLDKLAYEMAAGEGETLESLAALIGVESGHKAVFFETTRVHFAEIIPSEQAGTEEVMAALNRVLAQNAELAQYAHLI